MEVKESGTGNIFFRIQMISAFALGIIIPIIVISIALTRMNDVMDSLDSRMSVSEIEEQISSLQGKMNHSNDYALYTVMFLERTNESVVISKQLIRSMVVLIGLTVICIGLAFAVLGVKEGGVDLNGSVQGFAFDVKASTPGLAAIAVGAIMVTIGGVWPGQYTTNQSPSFGPMHAISIPAVLEEPKVSIEEITRRCTNLISRYPGSRTLESCVDSYAKEIGNGQ
jgi:hypothetical protein